MNAAAQVAWWGDGWALDRLVGGADPMLETRVRFMLQFERATLTRADAADGARGLITAAATAASLFEARALTDIDDETGRRFAIGTEAPIEPNVGDGFDLAYIEAGSAHLL